MGDSHESSESELESIQSPTSSVLESFRKEWEEELYKRSNSLESPQTSEKLENRKDTTTNTIIPESSTTNSEDDIEARAQELFLHGVSLEKLGQYYDACKFYKQAFQLVPDIERKVHHQQYTVINQSRDLTERRSEPESPLSESMRESAIDLKSLFLNRIKENGWTWFTRDHPDNSLHFGDFPEEVLSYIVSWVVGRDLDVRTLDVLSNVSRGFYVICRDENIWRDICSRIWGLTRKLPPGFSSFREMYMTRSRVRFDGCYISKITYVRSGENSFQDQSYRPWYLIDYYRYIRFFAHGVVLFLTTSEAPKDFSFSTLRDPIPKSNKILKGCYQLSGQTVTAQFTSTKSAQSKTTMQYEMEFTINPSKSKHNWILTWTNYGITVSSGISNVNNQFDMEPSKFPPLVFSRLKCFTKFSEYRLY